MSRDTLTPDDPNNPVKVGTVGDEAAPPYPPLDEGEQVHGEAAAGVMPGGLDRRALAAATHLVQTDPASAMRLHATHPDDEDAFNAAVEERLHTNRQAAPPSRAKGQRPWIVTDHDVPLAGGRDAPGPQPRRTYIDRGIPEWVHVPEAGKWVNAWEEIDQHERAEEPRLDEYGYGPPGDAHDRFGNRATAEYLEQQGVKPPDYARALKPYVDAARERAESGAADRLPPDLDRRPYEGNGDAHLLDGPRANGELQREPVPRTAERTGEDDGPPGPHPQPISPEVPLAPAQGARSFKGQESRPGRLLGSIDIVTVPKADGLGHEVRHAGSGQMIAEGRSAGEANARAHNLARELGRRRMERSFGGGPQGDGRAVAEGVPGQGFAGRKLGPRLGRDALHGPAPSSAGTGRLSGKDSLGSKVGEKSRARESGGSAASGVGKELFGSSSEQITRPPNSAHFESLPKLGNVEEFVNGLERKPTPTTRSCDLFEIEQTGPLNYRVVGGGTEFWIDGYEGRTILDTKFVDLPARSPFLADSNAPSFVGEGAILQEMKQFKNLSEILRDPAVPFDGLDVLVNDPRAVPYFEALIRQFKIPGKVRVVDTKIRPRKE